MSDDGILGRLRREAEREQPQSMYKVIRFFADSRPRRVIKTGLTLAQAQAWCQQPDTQGPGWFDGYDVES